MFKFTHELPVPSFNAATLTLFTNVAPPFENVAPPKFELPTTVKEPEIAWDPVFVSNCCQPVVSLTQIPSVVELPVSYTIRPLAGVEIAVR